MLFRKPILIGMRFTRHQREGRAGQSRLPDEASGAMLRVRTYLAASPIDGIGLFAAEPIPRGTIVWKLDERFDRAYDLHDIPADDRLLHDMLARYGYRISEAPVVILCGDDARFMNHSAVANTDEIGEMTIAVRDIPTGEEITCDYAKFDYGFAERDFILNTTARGGRAAA